MRDIRPDLEERLASTEAEHKRLQDQADRVSAQATILRDMISLENAKWAAAPSKGEAPPTGAVPPGNEAIEQAVLSLLNNGAEWPHADIKHDLEAKNLFRPDDAQHGRTLHGILMSMRHRGLVEIVEGKQGVWQRVKLSRHERINPPSPQKETGAKNGPGYVDLS